MTEKEKREMGLEYYSSDPEIAREHYECEDKCFELNNTRPSDLETKKKILKTILGKMGERIIVRTPFWCAYGYNVEVGDNFVVNHGCVMIDTAKITFGDNVFIGPSCGFYTAIHPFDPQKRATFLETAKPVRVGNNVWFASAVHVLPGVTIGNNVVIGAGSLVASDIPDNVLAYGNPCRVIRQIV